LISLYLGLTLFGLYQYKAHNRSWGMKLVVWMSGLALLVGVVMRFNFPLLPVFLTVGFCLAYFIGWRAIGGGLTGWRQHLFRGLAFALCLGPLAAARYVELWYFDEWLVAISNAPFPEILKFFFYSLPGFFLAGGIAFLVSAGCEIWQRADERFTAVVLSWRAKLGYGLILLALLLSVNWYIAGMSGIHYCARRGQTRMLSYILWSRPGSVNVKGELGETPLHYAAYVGHSEVAEMLLKAGADVNANKDGHTPLDWAIIGANDEIIRQLLRKHGAKTGAELDAEAKQDKVKE